MRLKREQQSSTKRLTVMSTRISQNCSCSRLPGQFLSDTALPDAFMASSMNDRSNYYDVLVFDHFVKHTVRKPFWITPTDILRRMLATILQRAGFKSIEYRKNLIDKFVAQS